MAFTVEWRDDKGVVISCSGVLTGQELINAIRSLVVEGSRGLRYAILDVSAVDKIDVSPADVRATVEVDRQLAAMAVPGMLVAIAAPQDLGFGLARMWEVFAGRETEWRISVFRSLDEANAWIQENLKGPEQS